MPQKISSNLLPSYTLDSFLQLVPPMLNMDSVPAIHSFQRPNGEVLQMVTKLRRHETRPLEEPCKMDELVVLIGLNQTDYNGHIGVVATPPSEDGRQGIKLLTRSSLTRVIRLKFENFDFLQREEESIRFVFLSRGFSPIDHPSVHNVRTHIFDDVQLTGATLQANGITVFKGITDPHDPRAVSYLAQKELKIYNILVEYYRSTHSLVNLSLHMLGYPYEQETMTYKLVMGSAQARRIAISMKVLFHENMRMFHRKISLDIFDIFEKTNELEVILGEAQPEEIWSEEQYVMCVRSQFRAHIWKALFRLGRFLMDSKELFKEIHGSIEQAIPAGEVTVNTVVFAEMHNEWNLRHSDFNSTFNRAKARLQEDMRFYDQPL